MELIVKKKDVNTVMLVRQFTQFTNLINLKFGYKSPICVHVS